MYTYASENIAFNVHSSITHKKRGNPNVQLIYIYIYIKIQVRDPLYNRVFFKAPN